MRSVCRSHSGDVLDICYNLSGPKSRSRVSRCVNPLWIQIVRIRNGGTTLSTLTFSEASYRRGTTYRREPDSVVAKDLSEICCAASFASVGENYVLSGARASEEKVRRAVNARGFGNKGDAVGSIPLGLAKDFMALIPIPA